MDIRIGQLQQNTRICSSLLLQTNDLFFLMISSFSAIIFQAILWVCDQNRLSDNATGLHYGKLYKVLYVFNLLFFFFFFQNPINFYFTR